ncbi:MAG: hypothetical protein F6K55_30895 [Moorea sp. SIO4A3]|nr:hypothetical protein [Moorena sp. SIO4A3]
MANLILNTEKAPLRSWGFPPLALCIKTRYGGVRSYRKKSGAFIVSRL